MAITSKDIRNSLDIIEGKPESFSGFMTGKDIISKKEMRDKLEKELRAEGYTDPDIIEFEIEDRLGLTTKGSIDDL